MGLTFEDALGDPDEGRIVILSIVTVPLCIIATVLRLVATRRSRRALGWDDLFAVLGLLGFLVYACTPFVGVAAAGDLDEEDLDILIAKLSYIASPFYYVNQLFVKASLFVLYYRIFWADRTFVRWVYILATIHVCWFITFLFFLLFLCTPVSKWWDVAGTQPGSCISGNAFLVPEEVTNSAIDFALVALTFVVIRKLKVTKHLRTKLTLVFLVGGLSGVIGFVKIGLVYGLDNTHGQENDANAFWDIMQMATSIFCACGPMYKTLLPLRSLWSRLKTSVSSWASRSRLYYRSVGSHKTESEQSTSSGRQRDVRGDANVTAGTVADWPQFVDGTETQYTWSEVEMVDIDFSNRPSAGSKNVQRQSNSEIV
ncbi:hypothetical protein KVR01_008571 [Diaporthe batatas]|uniref:uncharacterized protein n=1 Tax=Diaporthe batatas TaxID=748121 RepID=UPI001D04B1EC|nr:uncharacterized protein KVR01_008571 [Diaporthe batatas]KAG8161584.1 hypothetical protein KVR01_008571 [Diaporthe batatas]